MQTVFRRTGDTDTPLPPCSQDCFHRHSPPPDTPSCPCCPLTPYRLCCPHCPPPLCPYCSRCLCCPHWCFYRCCQACQGELKDKSVRNTHAYTHTYMDTWMSCRSTHKACLVCPQVFSCPSCLGVFCVDCDLFIHDSLHCCPGCLHHCPS